MKLVVLLAGVVDPKLRIARLRLHDAVAQVDETGFSRRLSPFDEAALETALQLRDANAAVQVTAVVVGDAASDALLRGVMAHPMHRAFRLGDALPWDPGAAIDHLRPAIAEADFVIMGREFGDGDDGVLPPALAEATRRRYCGMAHALCLQGEALLARRMRGMQEETVRIPAPGLVSVTNHRGNRLRHPLMKHVVVAKRAPLDIVAAGYTAPRSLTLCGIALAAPPERVKGQGRLHAVASDEAIADLAATLLRTPAA